MIALDTNVIVRLLVNDDPKQGRRAQDLVARGGIFVGATVLLETEWVLRAAYGFASDEVLRLFRALLGLPGMQSDEPARVARALDHYEAGLDFADALHLAFSADAEEFATFDLQFARRARSLRGPRVITP